MLKKNISKSGGYLLVLLSICLEKICISMYLAVMGKFSKTILTEQKKFQIVHMYVIVESEHKNNVVLTSFLDGTNPIILD